MGKKSFYKLSLVIALMGLSFSTTNFANDVEEINTKDTVEQTLENTTSSSEMIELDTTSTEVDDVLDVLDSNSVEQVEMTPSTDTTKKEVDFVETQETGYATIIKENISIWEVINTEKKSTSSAYLNETLEIKQKVIYNDGLTYYALYDNKGGWVGYLESSAVKRSDVAQGSYISDGSYVTITKKNSTIFSNFNWTKKSDTNQHLNKTYEARGRYDHFNGNTYYSLYTNQGVWIGYINADDVVKGDGKQGAYISDGSYVTVTKKDYPLWSNFGWTKKSDTNQHLNKTYQARGRYNHFNGSTYYSLYNDQGQWLGYVNTSAVTKGDGKQGAYISDGSYVTITKKNYSMWSDFNWTKKSESTQHLNKTYQARGRYNHFNGDTYYSLYNNQGKWMGYVNINATTKGNGRQGAYINDGSYVTISKNNYSMWSNFNWTKKSDTKQFMYKTYQARGRYEHFNGSSYYSLYNNKNQWMGYVNSDAVTKGNGAQGAYISDGRKQKVVNGNYDVWENFSWKKKTSSKTYLNQTFTMRGRYDHFNGSVYYSMYDAKGEWKGYLNANATAAPVTSRVIDSVPYVSQYTPIYAPYGCAVASMTMVLRSKGASVDLKYALDNLPMYPKYPGGQIGSPYTGVGFQRVIQPQELTNYMKRWYSKVYYIPGASSQEIANHILDGNPVLYYGYSSYQSSNTRNHVKVIAGYKNNQFLIYDPLYFNKNSGPGTSGKHPIYDRGAMHWLPVSEFNKEYGGRAIVAK